ncbi:unnamed protein product [Rotaria sordida]|uniref:Uncharacterized protein n=1 Tax=Rotaria sordida TaxID=392033 RepID=A0A820A3A5_9BILA|nr:unnamed protein product [Rotaria sordida]
MPSKIIPCVLCGKQGRLARSKYTKICTTEREEKIREGYRRRRGQELNAALLYQQVHVNCYKSLVFDLEPLSFIINRREQKKIKLSSDKTQNSNSVLIDITNTRNKLYCDDDNEVR